MYNVINSFLSRDEFIKSLDETYDVFKTNKKIEYVNLPLSFDIESSSFYEDDEKKRAIMYAFVLGCNGKCVLGRTWEEFIDYIDILKDKFDIILKERHLIIYIHNLSFEFQFFRKLFEWDSVFSVEDRKPVKAITKDGIEFRCSYLLSGYNLKKVGEHLQKYKCEKMVGDLDYSLIRHSITPLTYTEKGYILNDGIIVMNYIQELIEELGNITRIPLTKTGFVRTYCRNKCLYEGNHKKNAIKYLNYHSMIKNIPISSVNEYKQLKRAFMGGFTHANPLKVGAIIENVHSFDFTSSYPFVMLSEKFPMGKGELITIKSFDELNKNLKCYCCVFDITFYNIRSSVDYEHIISFSKCWGVENYEIDNGRIVHADKLSITITEQDFAVFRSFYEWDRIIVKNFRRYVKNYLPKDFVLSILKLYADKTELKNVEGKEIEYLHGKENLNSCYGMCVTDICKDDTLYENGEWLNKMCDFDESLNKYNNSKNRFLCYQWGIWVTAYARRNLFTGIYEFKDDYNYADTDSLKVCNIDSHINYINDYNKKVEIKLIKAMNYHKLSFDLCKPKTKEGKEKLIGVWDYEGKYERFKSLGAKRYMVLKDDKIEITISGLNKKVTTPYLTSGWCCDLVTHKEINSPFYKFTDGMYIPKDFTGKNIHTYIDNEIEGEIIDYKGISNEYKELSSVHLEKADYTLSLANEYIEYLRGIRRWNR